MQPTDVKSATRTSDGQIVSGRARLKGFDLASSVVTSTANSVILYNGTSVSDPFVMQFDIPGYAQYGSRWAFNIPGNGLMFTDGIYVDMGASVNRFTVIYQG